jgi:hypothetical protein
MEHLMTTSTDYLSSGLEKTKAGTLQAFSTCPFLRPFDENFS